MELNVRVMNGQDTNKTEFNFMTEELKNEVRNVTGLENKINIIRPMIKSAIATLMQSIVLDTPLNLYDISLDITNGIHKVISNGSLAEKISISPKLLEVVIKNEILSVALAATAYNQKELVEELKKASFSIYDLVLDIYELINE